VLLNNNVGIRERVHKEDRKAAKTPLMIIYANDQVAYCRYHTLGKVNVNEALMIFGLISMGIEK